MTPTTSSHFYQLILQPSALAISGIRPKLDTPEARCMMLAVAGQESGWTTRIQVPNGQARGFWQCELDGALAGVMRSEHATLAAVGSLYSIDVDVDATVWEAIAWHDALAYTVARLALWMDPRPLPAIGDVDGAWETYLRAWRPGKPSRERWNLVYPQAASMFLNIS